MSKSLLSGLALSVLLAGCATSQENPNYKISSKYKGVEATTQLASIQTSPTIQGANYGKPKLAISRMRGLESQLRLSLLQQINNMRVKICKERQGMGYLFQTPMMSGNYVVKQGDTMYSLSRNLCVDLNTLALTNGIGNDFAIKIGQSLNLPASRC